MRLRTLAVEKYGNFDRLHLSFDPRPGCINLIVAPNGAGKSVLRQALHDLLFEIAKQSPMKFRHGYAEMILYAEAVTAAGEPLVFGWSRKHSRTFGPGGEHRARLDAVLGRVTEQRAKLLFSLDTAALRKGGQELAEGGDSLGAAMLSGTGELASARALRTSLQQRADDIWERSKSSKPLNKAVRAIVDAKGELRNAVQQPRQRLSQTTAMAEQQRMLAQARSQLGVAQALFGQLARVDRVRPHLDAFAASDEWLSVNSGTPVLDPSLHETLTLTRAAAARCIARQTDAQAVHDRAQAALLGRSRDQAALDIADQLAALPERLGMIDKAARDKAGLERGAAEARIRISALLRAIGAADGNAPLPTVPAKARARELIQRDAGIAEALAGAQRRLSAANVELASLSQAPAPPALASIADELRLLVQEIRSDRDPVRHAAEQGETLRRATAAAHAATSRVPGWTNAPITLQEGAAAAGHFARLDDTVRKTQEKANDRAVRHGTATARVAELRHALEQLRAAPLPDAASLAAARARRDAGWRLIHRRAFPDGPPDLAAEAEYAGSDPLPLVFERDLRAADVVADRRIDELARVEQAEQLRRQIDAGSSGLAALEADATQAALDRNAAVAAWAAACSAIALPCDAPLADVREALKSRHDAREAVQGESAANAEHAALVAHHAAWAARLARLLAIPPGGDLAGLLEQASAELARADKAGMAAGEHRLWVGNATRELAAAEAAQRAALGDRKAWSACWSTALSALQRPVDESPSATAAVLDQFSVLERDLEKASDVAGRLAGIGHDAAQFGADVDRLAALLGMEPGTPAEDAARVLIQRNKLAGEGAAAWDEAAKAAKAAEADLVTATNAASVALHDLQALIALCGATDADDAERRLSAARERAKHEAQRQAALAALQREEPPMGVLREEALLHPAEGMAVARRNAEAAQTAASAAAEDAAVALSRLEHQAAADAAATLAIEAAHQHEAAATRFAHLLDDFVLVHVAKTMLSRAMEAVEQGVGATGLRRISDAFAITSGGTHTLVADEAEGETVLRAIEGRFPHERRGISELSEGLRDQLYLALRLVAIEEHVATAPALPFVADDILQTFDDDRALASLHGLLSLSRHAQVIVLSHHAHIGELARRLPPGSVHVQDLAATA